MGLVRVARLLIALGAVAGAGLPLHAEGVATPPPPTTRAITEIEAAQLLLQNGKLAEAGKVLADILRAHPDDPEALFLAGLLAVQDKDYAGAVRDFRRILVREPGAVRVRLELGRAFFLQKDYDNAERQFHLALAGDLPDAARRNVAQYLYAIRQARVWSYNLSIAAAPDTDLNAGPSIQTIDIFGLPFQLSDQARRQSGVGLALDAGGEWSPPVGASGLRLRLGAQLNTDDYRQGEFDDTTLSGYAGARLVSGRWDVSPVATYYRRWYGGALYDQGLGGSLQTTYYATPRLALNGGVGGQYVSFAQLPSQNGPAISSSLGAAYTLSTTSFVSGQAAVARQWAAFNGYSNTAVQVQLGYNRDLRGGLSLSLAPSWVRIGYDAPLAGFGVTRLDNQWQMQMTLLYRRIDLAGFTPSFSYTYTRNFSNIPLYSYERNRFEAGVTRVF